MEEIIYAVGQASCSSSSRHTAGIRHSFGAPPITLWEHRNALRKLSADGLKSVDEKLIFQTIAAQRELIAAARLRTRSARLAHARSTAAESKSAAVEPVSDQPDQNAPSHTDTLPPFAVDDWS